MAKNLMRILAVVAVVWFLVFVAFGRGILSMDFFAFFSLVTSLFLGLIFCICGVSAFIHKCGYVPDGLSISYAEGEDVKWLGLLMTIVGLTIFAITVIVCIFAYFAVSR